MTAHARSTGTLRAHVYALRGCVHALIAEGAHRILEGVYPMPAVASPRSVVCGPGEFSKLMAVANRWEQLFLLLAHDQALRARAALALSATEYDPLRGEIRSRGKKDRLTVVPVSIRTMAALADCPTGVGSFVSRMAGFTVHYHNIRPRFRVLVARAGVNPALTIHDLRRTMAESAYRVSGDLRVVQQLLGHRHVTTTHHYLQRPASDAVMAAIRAAQERA